MKNLHLLIPMLFLSLAISFSSCSDDDSEDQVDPIEEVSVEMQLIKSWKQIEYNVLVDGNWIDDHPNQEVCTSDDLIVFKTNSEVCFDEGATKCDPNDDQVYANGTWSLSSDEMSVEIMIVNQSQNFNIVSLTENRLELELPEFEDGQYDVRIVLEAQ